MRDEYSLNFRVGTNVLIDDTQDIHLSVISQTPFGSLWATRPTSKMPRELR